MKLFQFIKWWWDKHDAPDCMVAICFFSILLCAPACAIFGLVGLLYVFLLLISVGIISLLYTVGVYAYEQWGRFTDEKQREADEIVRRLSNKSNW